MLLGNARHPSAIGLNRSVQPGGVLEDNIARRLHLATGYLQIGEGIGPAFQTLSPFTLPTAQNRPKIAQPL